MIELSIYNMIGVCIGSIFITGFYTPIQPIKNRLLNLLPDNYIGRSCQTIFQCPKCMGFLLSLVLFWDIIAAVLISMLAYFINHLIDRVESWYQ